jgi:hypothetical protein
VLSATTADVPASRKRQIQAVALATFPTENRND